MEMDAESIRFRRLEVEALHSKIFKWAGVGSSRFNGPYQGSAHPWQLINLFTAIHSCVGNAKFLRAYSVQEAFRGRGLEASLLQLSP